MLRNLQTNGSQYANAMYKAKTDIKRGSFVQVDEQTMEVKLATGIAGAKLINRGLKLTKDVAMEMYPVDEYSDDQDIIKEKEMGYLNELEGRWASTEYDSSVESSAIDSYLTIANGKLKASSTPTIIIFKGFVTEGSHKLAKFEFDHTVKLA